MSQPRIQLACSTLNYNAFSFQRAIEGIKGAGYEYISIGINHEKKHKIPNHRMSDREIGELNKQIKDQGLKVNSALSFEFHIGDADSVTFFQRELDQLAALGCHRVIIGGPWYYTKWPTEIKAPERYEAECEAFYSAMEKILPRAEALKTIVCVKPHTGLCGHSGRVREVLKRLPSASLKVCWDAGNVSFYEGVCPDLGLPAIVPEIRAICLKDHKGLRAHPVFPPLGEGNVDHDEYFAILARGGFEGPMMIERLGIREGEHPLTPEQLDERGARVLQFLTPMLEKHFSHAVAPAAH
jgi:sugar phosphate isomerase/epimerase